MNFFIACMDVSDEAVEREIVEFTDRIKQIISRFVIYS